MNLVTIIGIAGGSGSGKTTFARKLNERLCQTHGQEASAILAQDAYYIDQSAKFRGDGDPAVNFDHPSAIDFALIASHLGDLKLCLSVQVPIYDFATHTRASLTTDFPSRRFILLDGMLLFSQPKILELLNYRIFVDAPEAIRYQRRLNRDVRERGRTPEGVEKQFHAQVKPMHDEFIEPSKQNADLIVLGTEDFEPVILEMVRKFRLN
jgi:uridine kinase